MAIGASFFSFASCKQVLTKTSNDCQSLVMVQLHLNKWHQLSLMKWWQRLKSESAQVARHTYKQRSKPWWHCVYHCDVSSGVVQRAMKNYTPRIWVPSQIDSHRYSTVDSTIHFKNNIHTEEASQHLCTIDITWHNPTFYATCSLKHDSMIFLTPKDPQSSLSNQWWVPWWIPRSPLAPGLRQKSQTSGWNIRMMDTRYPLNKTSQFESVPDEDYPVILRLLGFFSSSFSRKIHHPWVDEIKLNRYHPSPRHCQVNDPLEGLPVAEVFGRCNQFFANVPGWTSRTSELTNRHLVHYRYNHWWLSMQHWEFS